MLFLKSTAVAGLLVSSCTSNPSGNPPGSLGRAEPASSSQVQPVKVSALGRLEPVENVIGIGVREGGRLDRLLVVEGQEVKKGELLAFLDNHAERLAEKSYIGAQLEEAEVRLAAEKGRGEARIREAEARIRQLQTVQPLNIDAQQARVEMIEAELATARSDLERINVLVGRGFNTQENLDHQKLLVDQRQASLKEARATLEKLRSALEVDTVLAKQQLITAQADLTHAQSLIQIESLKASVRLAEERLERTLLRAPRDGRILKILIRPGESASGPIVQMGDTSQMFAIAEIYETDIKRIRVGQKAKVTSPALENALTGTVTEIGSTIQKNDVLGVDPTADTDSRVVEVKIRLNSDDLASRLVYLQVDVDIFL